MSEKSVYERIKQLFEEICNGRIREASRKKDDTGSWTRERNMPLRDILRCILGKKGLSTVMEVRHYFGAAEKEDQTVSKQDYLQQRQKLNPEVFKQLNEGYLKGFYSGAEAQEWNGYLVMATDGSRAEIPNSAENRKTYGESENKYGKGVARANISALHDVLNRFILDVGIHTYKDSEIEEAKAHIAALKGIVGERPVAIMFDRNYASLEFADFLEKSGVKYLIRLHNGDYAAERAGMKSDDEEVELACTKHRVRQLKKKSPERAAELERQQSVKVRIVNTVFDNKEQASFMTNLREGSADEIKELYRKRWSIEQKYHTLKNKLKFESVTGKASIYVKQDFWAQMIVFNIVQDLITAAEDRAVKKAKEKALKYEVRINENIAIGLFKEKFIKLTIEDDALKKAEMYNRLIADMEKYIVPVRTLKGAPRKWTTCNKYKCNLKPSF
jgi:hypothetical protein